MGVDNSHALSITYIGRYMNIAYHVSPRKNLAEILNGGLIPQLGSRSILAQEQKKRVYLFSSKIALEDGLGNWLGDMFEDEELVILAINITGLNTYSDVEYELISEEAIPARNIVAVLKDGYGFPIDDNYCHQDSIRCYLNNVSKIAFE